MADVVVVGGGVNGLTTAALIGAAGHPVLVLERRDRLGGVAVTEEFHPGFQVSSGLHRCPQLCPDVVSELDLPRHGLRPIAEPVGVFAPSADGPGVLLPGESGLALGPGPEGLSDRDATRLGELDAFLQRLDPLLKAVRQSSPVAPEQGWRGGLFEGLGLGRRVGGLGRDDRRELMRIAPMCIADYLREWFDSDLVCAALAAPALWWGWTGPYSSGTVASWLLDRPGSSRSLLRGGMGNLTQALAGAAREAGVELRTGCAVTAIELAQGRARGVRLASGEQLAADVVVAACDPRHALLELVGTTQLAPTLAWRVGALRCRGTAAKVHLALDGLPELAARPGDGVHLHGRIHIGADIDTLERAFDPVKYGRLPERPMLDVLLPTATDPSMAPEGQHVASILVHHVPYELRDGDWTSGRERLGDAVVSTLAEHVPGLTDKVLHREVLAPPDLADRFGVSGGHLAHIEHAIDQLFAMRPLPGCQRYGTPIPGLFLCGMGTHPGGGLSSRPGANAAREILRVL